MKKFIFLFILLLVLILTCPAFSSKVAVLSDILKPDSIVVDNHQVIITEKASLYLYSIKDFRLMKKFGKQGEGPQEFRITSYGGSGLFLDVQPRVFLVSSVGKLSLFTRKGKFIKEMKTSHNFFGSRFMALGKQYVGLGSTVEGNINYLTVNVYDSGLNKMKEVCKWESPYRPGIGTQVFNEPYVFWPTSDGDKILTSNGIEFKIDVYSSNGKKLYAINQPYKKIKVTAETKKAVIHYFKTSPSTKDVFQFIKPIKFPEYLPAIRNFIVRDKKVYILTFKQEDHKSEFYIFNLKGKLLDHVFLTLKEETVLTYFPYHIKNDKLYQLVENEEDEKWELYVTEI